MADQNRQLEGQMAEQGMQRARVERQLAAELQQAHMLLDEQAQVMRCAAAVCCIVLLDCAAVISFDCTATNIQSAYVRCRLRKRRATS